MNKTMALCKNEIPGANNWKELLRGLGVHPAADNIIIELSTQDCNLSAFNNIFSLYSDDEEKTTIVTDSLVEIIETLAESVNNLSVSKLTDYNELLIPASQAVRALRYADVGVGDTDTDECIVFDFGEKLQCTNRVMCIINTEADIEKLKSMFYQLIHNDRKHNGVWV